MAEALRERAQRIYEKYGNVMLETAGMTKAGIERKATCRALFSKILYLAGVLACICYGVPHVFMCCSDCASMCACPPQVSRFERECVSC